VADDVMAVRANGVSRSSSRSSGFDEISSAVTEFSSLLPVTAAHASNDGPETIEINLLETSDDANKQVLLCCELGNNIEKKTVINTCVVTIRFFVF